jgi:hypothetical protein
MKQNSHAGIIGSPDRHYLGFTVGTGAPTSAAMPPAVAYMSGSTNHLAGRQAVHSTCLKILQGQVLPELHISISSYVKAPNSKSTRPKYGADGQKVKQ